ncbi:MAG: hypothetical protein OXL97_01530 [Chloroflexota bacterium]|nr:hypothetical protein [Chloroflexota bacterium]MDE2885802.1 hypothetical protein [Chloroflexota bacterium]
MVGYSPGGGTTRQARYMADEWPRFIPGSPDIRVINLTPNVVERNFVWNAEPDGLTLAVEATLGVGHLADPQAQFDPRESTMLGVTSGAEGVWLIRGTLPYDCIDDAFGAIQPELTVGLSALTPEELGHSVSIGWLADRFNVPLEMRNFPGVGAPEQYRMIERGDVNSWITGTIWDQLPVTRPGWARSGYLRPFTDLSPPGFTPGHNGERNFHCPNFHDTYLENDEERALWLAMRSYVTFGRNVIGPPGMPAELTQALRGALTAAMADARFADGLKAVVGVRNTFIDGATAHRLVADVVDSFEANRAEIERIQQDVFAKYVR